MTPTQINALVEMYLQQQKLSISGKNIITMANDANIRIEVGRIKRKLYHHKLAKTYSDAKFTQD